MSFAEENPQICKVINEFYDSCVKAPECKDCGYRHNIKQDVIVYIRSLFEEDLKLENSLQMPGKNIYDKVYDAGKACLANNPVAVLEHLLEAKNFVSLLAENLAKGNADEKMQEVLMVISKQREDWIRAKKLGLDISTELEYLENARNNMRDEKYDIALDYANKANEALTKKLKEATSPQN
jgi:hypothetical protein